MRFSIWPSPARPWDEVLELTRHCEQTGWDGVYIADHFMPNTADGSVADGPIHECWTTLAGLAAAVPRLRLGSLVSGNTYRHPAVLANMAATIDHISGGRLLLGIGAGWQVNEHEAFGIDLPAPRERLDRFEEACAVITGMLRDDRTTVAGRHYRVTDAPCDPKPLQERMPVLIGGSGEKRTMRIAARYADEWNAWSTPEVLDHKVGVLRAHCDELGRDPAEIAVSTQALLYMSDDEAWLASKRDDPGARAAMIGSPGEVAEQVAAYAAAGCDELIVPDFTMGSMARRKETCDQFLAEVASNFR